MEVRLKLASFVTAVLPPVALIAAIAITACSSAPPPPPPVEKKPELDPAVSQKIDEALDLLNNPNIEERWRNQLVSAAQTDELARRAAIDRTVAAVKRSYATPGGGMGILKAPGRRRAIEALDRFAGDDPAALEIFKQGVKEGDAEVASAAAAALASRGDDSAFQSLVQAVRAARNDRATQDRAAKGLLKIVKPDRKEYLLGALDAGSRDALAPVVSACLPADPEARVKELASICRENGNPQARIFALDELRKANDPELVDFARTQAGAEDGELRGYSLRLIAAQSGKVAALQLGDVLAKDAKDPDGTAKLLASIDAPETPRVATDILADTSAPAKSRAACARHVLSRLRDDAAPASLRDPAARERGLAALRRAIKDSNDEVASASIESLGAAGDDSDAEALALLLTSVPQQGPAIVKALGRIGGQVAVETLVERHANEPKLRAACREALVGMRGLKQIPLEQGFLLIQQLRASDLEVRKSALEILRALKGDSDVHDYNPAADADARNRAVERWKNWWKDKVARRGG